MKSSCCFMTYFLKKSWSSHIKISSVSPSTITGPDECNTKFRFRQKNDIHLFADILRIPRFLICSQGTICGGVEGLCIFLRRLAYPCRHSDLVQRFGRPAPELSMINNTVMNYIYDKQHQRLTVWNRALLRPVKQEEYTEAISNKLNTETRCKRRGTLGISGSFVNQPSTHTELCKNFVQKKRSPSSNQSVAFICLSCFQDLLRYFLESIFLLKRTL